MVKMIKFGLCVFYHNKNKELSMRAEVQQNAVILEESQRLEFDDLGLTLSLFSYIY